MRYQHEAAAELFLKIARKDNDIDRIYTFISDLVASVIGMYYRKIKFENYKQYAFYAKEWLEDFVASDRYYASHIVDLCYLRAICGDSINNACGPLRLFDAMSENAWNELASMALAVSKNKGTLGEALLIGIEDPVIWSRIGSFYAEFVNDYNKALAFYERALMIEPNAPNFYFSKAQVYAYNLNDFAKAKKCLNFVHSLRHRKLAWYKSKKRAGVFLNLEKFISEENSSHT